MAVPIPDHLTGSCLGVLGALHRDRDAFDNGCVRTLNLLAGVAGAAITATEREQALRDSRADRRMQEDRADLLSSLVEKVREGVALVDREGVIRYSNPAFGNLFALAPSQLFGRSANSLLDDAAGLTWSGSTHLPWNEDKLELMVPRPEQDGPRVIALSRTQFEYGATRAPGWIVTARDATERARWVARLRYHGEHDDLTGLPNRHRLKRRLLEATTDGRGAGRVGVFFIDLDGTKTVNDALGHQAGDELLRVVANRLQACVRPGDLVARYGGDELVALVEPISEADAPLFAKRLLAAFSEPVQLGGQSVRLSASLGFAVCRSPSDPDSLLREADSAMYAAKRAGGNGWRAFQSELHDSALADLQLSGELQAALDNRS